MRSVHQCQPKVGGRPFLPSESAKMSASRKSPVHVLVRGRRPVAGQRTSGNSQELMSVNWSGQVKQLEHRQFGAMSWHLMETIERSYWSSCQQVDVMLKSRHLRRAIRHCQSFLRVAEWKEVIP